jgi:YD repeat-containing protein
MGTATKTIQYHYDSVGNRTGLTDPDGGRFTHAYDSLNRRAGAPNSGRFSRLF